MSVEHVDLFDPATQENWYPAYDLLREDAPVYRMPGSNVYVLTRYEDVAWVSKHTELFLNGPAIDSALVHDAEALQIYRASGRVRRAPLSTDPPVHRRYRALVDPMFSAGGAERQRDLITRVVDELIDDWIDEGEIEFVTRFALPLPMIIITVMLGLPLDDFQQLKKWSAAWVMPFAGRLTPEQQRYVAQQGVEFQDYLAGHIAAKRQTPDDTVISHLAQTTFESLDGPRPLTDDEIIFITDHLFIGGNETTTFALTSGLWLMLRDPRVDAELRADRSRLPTFVEETMRLESPTQGLFRNAIEDVEINGVLVPKGSTLHLRFAAANRDPRFFEDPSMVDLHRANAARHVAFGQGEHHCPGAGLSRLEQNIALGRLLDRTSAWWLVEGRNDFRHKPGFVLRALEELRIGFTKA